MTPNFKESLSKVKKEIEKVIRNLYFTRGIELQKNAIEKLGTLKKEISKEKEISIKEKDERTANGILGLELLIETYINMFKMMVQIKEEKTNEAWDSLILAQNNLHYSTMAGKGIFEFGVENIEYFLNCYENVIFPPQSFMSVGTVVEKSECSICGSEYGECNHIKGYPYMGQICVERITKIKNIREVSFVPSPASKLHRVTGILENGRWVDKITGRSGDTIKKEK